jgi:hypothetical protein
MEKVTFYREWLPLPKAEFNVLTMIAEQGGTFTGNWSEMCRYINLTAQDRNRKVLQAAVESLTSKGFLTCDTRGRTHHLKVIPKETEVRLPRLWVQSVIRHDYSSEKVAFAQVLKVFVWITQNRMKVVTNAMIAAELGISESTVCSAKNVLQYEYENITKRKVSEKWGDDFISLGQELAASAFWKEL